MVCQMCRIANRMRTPPGARHGHDLVAARGQRPGHLAGELVGGVLEGVMVAPHALRVGRERGFHLWSCPLYVPDSFALDGADLLDAKP